MPLMNVMIVAMLDGGGLLAGYYQSEKRIFAQSQHLAIFSPELEFAARVRGRRASRCRVRLLGWTGLCNGAAHYVVNRCH
jgi:hypothetical protein